MLDTKVIDFSTRQPLPDLIRVWALLGIVLVNVAGFSWPFEQGYKAPVHTSLDHAVDYAVTLIFTTKSYALFSLMFGASLAFQTVSAKRHFRRMSGLFAIGALHASFFFLGDILVLYALLGSLLYAFRSAKPKTLVITGLSFLMAQVIILFLFAGLIYLSQSIEPPTDTQSFESQIQAAKDHALTAFDDGTFLEATHYRASQTPGTVLSFVFSQGFAVFGYFLLGLAIAKEGLIHAPQADFWHKCRWMALPIGLAGNAFAAHFYTSADTIASAQSMIGIGLLTLFAPFSAFGYAGWIAKYAAGPASAIKAFLARAGTATLTAYIMQSVILSFIFSAYGLDLYAKLEAAQAITIGLVTGLFTLVFVSVWRKFFARGPMETLLRSWTYLGNR